MLEWLKPWIVKNNVDGVVVCGRPVYWYITYHDNGFVKEIVRWDKGRREGVCMRRHDNGVMSELCSYEGGELHGKMIRWDRNRQLFEKRIYRRGEVIRHYCV